MKPNYFKIGLFVIIAFILIIIAVVVFGSGLFAEEKVYFESYFDGSVSGLNIGAHLENRGVRIGRVEKITFARYEYNIPRGSEDYFKYANYVIVLSSIDLENLQEMTVEQRQQNLEQMISLGFRVRLASNLLTGQAFLEADYLDPNRYPVLEMPWEPKHFYLPTAPGEFTSMKESVDNILSQLEQIDTKEIGRLIEQILISVNRAINDANVSVVADEVRKLFAEARLTNQNLQKLLESPQKDSQKANIAVMVAQLNKTLLRIDKLITAQTPKAEQALDELQKILANLSDLTESLKRHPSELIFSQPPPKSEALK
jgi:phospholipid/cholesterol/gamma-HCH transport system substrate-binding protein/paraquat-inducible protein B